MNIHSPAQLNNTYLCLLGANLNLSRVARTKSPLEAAGEKREKMHKNGEAIFQRQGAEDARVG